MGFAGTGRNAVGGNADDEAADGRVSHRLRRREPVERRSRHVRALLLLSATIVPSIFIVSLVVFGRQVRNRMLHTSSMPVLIRLIWSGLYIVVSLFIALMVLTVIYRVGWPGHHGLKAHCPARRSPRFYGGWSASRWDFICEPCRTALFMGFGGHHRPDAVDAINGNDSAHWRCV